MSENTLLNIVLGYFNAYSSHKVADITAFYDDGIEIYDGAFDELTKGKAKVQENVVDVFLDLVPDLTWRQQENTPVLVDGDSVSIEWVFSGSPNTSLEGIPDDCKGAFICKGMSRFKIDPNNKRILSHADYYSPPSFFAYL